MNSSTLKAALLAQGLCIYRRAYTVELCGEQSQQGKQVCEKHSENRCWCGEQAVQECDHCGLHFVCGARLCAEHGCRMSDYDCGLGSPLHSEEGHRQWLDFQGTKT